MQVMTGHDPEKGREDTMTHILVDAYDPRHPEHVVMMNLECDAGWDIELLPNFEVIVEVPDSTSSDK